MHPASLPRRARFHGFTLLELLVTLVVGGLLMVVITTVATSQVRLQRTQLITQQRRSDWSRFTTFLSHEVGEGRLVRTNTTTNELQTVACTIPTGGSLLFSVTVPIATNDGAPVERSIHYYTTGTDTSTTLFRCGPSILSTGRLNDTVTTFTPARLLSGIPLSAAIDANQVSVTICNYTTPVCQVGAAASAQDSIRANIRPFAVRTRSIDIP